MDMKTIHSGLRTFDVVLEEKVQFKVKDFNVKEEEIFTMIQNNEEAVADAEENEEVMLIGGITVTFYKKDNQLIVTNLFGSQHTL
jgi:hypothetical protein